MALVYIVPVKKVPIEKILEDIEKDVRVYTYQVLSIIPGVVHYPEV